MRDYTKEIGTLVTELKAEVAAAIQLCENVSTDIHQMILDIPSGTNQEISGKLVGLHRQVCEALMRLEGNA